MHLLSNLYAAAIVTASALAVPAHATVVANSLPYTNTPDWSDVTFAGTSMTLGMGGSVLSTTPYRGVWFGWLGSQNPPGWSIANNSAGNYLSLKANFSAGSSYWSAYMSDGLRFADLTFNPPPCNPNLMDCYIPAPAVGVNLRFAGTTIGSSVVQFVALDTTQTNSFEWLLLGNSVTYRINGLAYSGTAAVAVGAKYLIIGDDSGSSPSGTGQMRIASVAFDAGPAFATLPSDVPEPASWAMLIAGFGLVGAAMRRRRAVGIA